MAAVDCFGNEIHKDVKILIERNAKNAVNQRSDAWLKKRNEMVTASSAASVLRLTQLEIDLRDNGIIELESNKYVGNVMPAFNTYNKELRIKCGVEPPGQGSVYTEWGVTYESIVKELYQHFHGVEVHEFGLIPHLNLNWLGASPDGVTSHGKMIEIKCPYSRVPIGKPKCQYWVQMQIQMECCGFKECDFLDVSIREYANRSEYLNNAYDDGKNNIQCRTKNGMPKGMVIEHTVVNYDKDGKEKVHHNYFYPPVLTFNTADEEIQWINEWCNQYVANNPMGQRMASTLVGENQDHHYRIRYWYIEKWTDCTIQKDETWLQQRLPDIYEFWKLVLKYRVEGLPNKISREEQKKNTQQQQQFFIDSQGHLTKQIEEAQTECLFWDGDDDINQPIITNIQDVTLNKTTTKQTKKRTHEEPEYSECLFGPDDDVD